MHEVLNSMKQHLTQNFYTKTQKFWKISNNFKNPKS